MQYYVRVGVGFALGLAAVGGLSFVFDAWYWTAAAAAFTGMLGFLATFFLWSTDRPATATDPGYEQVLFDNPNIVHSLLLAALMVGVSSGAGALLGGDAPPADPMAAALSQERADVAALANAYAGDLKAFQAKELDGAAFGEKVKAQQESLAELRAAHDAREVTEPYAETQDLLLSMLMNLGFTFDAAAKCAAGDDNGCFDARISMADYTAAADKAKAAVAALG